MKSHWLFFCIGLACCCAVAAAATPWTEASHWRHAVYNDAGANISRTAWLADADDEALATCMLDDEIDDDAGGKGLNGHRTRKPVFSLLFKFPASALFACHSPRAPLYILYKQIKGFLH